MVAFATQVKRRRGTTAQNDAFTGAEGEIVVDTQKHTLRVHDGETQGGFEMATQADLNNKADTSYIDGLLATKADTDLGNIPTNYDYVVESQEPTSANGYTWYRKYKSGWVEQGGYVAVSGQQNITITLPVEMADANYVVQITNDFNNAESQYGSQCNGRSTTQIIIKCGSYSSGDQMHANWQVSGMSAQ